MADLHIVIAIYPGVTHLDFTGPHQVFAHTPETKVTVASPGGQDVYAEGLTFAKLEDLAAISECDVLVVPGGNCIDLLNDADFIAQIRRLGTGARFVTSVCNGALILGAAGFLKGKRATTHWSFRDLLLPFGAIRSDARVERDGNVITGGGVTAGIDFALTLIAELKSRDVAEIVQLVLEYAPSPPFVGGTPELARPEILAQTLAMTAPVLKSCEERIMQAASKI